MAQGVYRRLCLYADSTVLISGVSNFTSAKLNREHGLPDLHRVRSADSPVDGIGIFSSWPAFD